MFTLINVIIRVVNNGVKVKSDALYQLHLMHHVIPATSAATERAFSAAGLIVSDRRNRLDVNIVESLLLAKCNSDLF